MDKYFVHESSYIDEGAEIGEGTKIWHFCHIMPGSKIGKDCSLGQNVVVSPGVEIGDGVKIQNNVSVYTGVKVKEGAFLGPSCVFTNVVNPRSFIERKDEYKETIIGKGASIGANATIICGNSIGDYALVGAGTVVTKDIGQYEVFVGNPGRLHGYICQCGISLEKISDDEYACPSCGEKYEKKDGKLVKKE